MRNQLELNNCYGRPSTYKCRAYEYCKQLQYKLDGYNATILSYNTTQFSFMFECVLDCQVVYIYITKDYDYIIM